MTNERGFIALARGVLDHPVIGAQKPFSDFEAWTWILFEASWKPRRVRVSNGRSAAVVDLKRGDLSHSLSYMAEAWGWSIKRVRTFLDRLETDSQTTRQTGTLQNVITVCNYETYQSPLSERGTQTGTQTGSQWARNGHEEEQSNKETSNKPRRASRVRGEPEGFSDWYESYPKKKKRDDAAKAFGQVVPSKVLLSELMPMTAAFAACWAARPAGDMKYCPYPASWLRSGEYRDAVDAPKSASPGEFQIKAPEKAVKDFTEADWLKRLDMRRRGVGWSNFWGPEPGHPGCIVPVHLLVGILPARTGTNG